MCEYILSFKDYFFCFIWLFFLNYFNLVLEEDYFLIYKGIVIMMRKR